MCILNQDKFETHFSSLLKEQVGTKRDKETVDESTNRIKSLLFKVKLGFFMESTGLRWYYCFCCNTFSISGEISSNEWLLRSESLWNCMWKTGHIFWTWLWWSLVWISQTTLMLGNVVMWFTRSLSFSRDVAGGAVIVREAGGVVFDP